MRLALALALDGARSIASVCRPQVSRCRAVIYLVLQRPAMRVDLVNALLRSPSLLSCICRLRRVLLSPLAWRRGRMRSLVCLWRHLLIPPTLPRCPTNLRLYVRSALQQVSEREHENTKIQVMNLVIYLKAAASLSAHRAHSTLRNRVDQHQWVNLASLATRHRSIARLHARYAIAAVWKVVLHGPTHCGYGSVGVLFR